MKINWKYAIGEVIIVIVGISVAFLLNNWASERKEAKIRQQYLVNLANDLSGEIDHLTTNIEKLDAHVAVASQLLSVMGREVPGRDSLARKVFEIARVINFLPNNTTYNTLTHSGHMSLIGDLELRHEIEAHYNRHKLIEQDYERQIKIHEKYMGDFFIHELDYDRIFRGDVSFLDKPVLKNIIQSLRGAILIAKNASQKGIESNQALLEMVEKQLE